VAVLELHGEEGGGAWDDVTAVVDHGLDGVRGGGGSAIRDGAYWLGLRGYLGSQVT
jgi:hypothetical protein